jgi:DNA invertase Pin-like site-specific DNA recombinase
MTSWGIYARVSYAKGAGDLDSVTRQVANTVADIARAGGTLAADPGSLIDPRDPSAGRWPAGCFVDNDVRASAGHAPDAEYHRLMRAGLDVIAFADLDRLWRNDVERSLALEELARAGVLLFQRGRLLDPRLPDDRFDLGLHGELASREIRKTAWRARENNASRAGRGRIGSGPTPFGYRQVWQPEPSGRRLFLGWEEEPAEAAAVRDGIAARIGGASWPAVAAGLNGAGFTTRRGKPWDGAGAAHCLTAPRVAGIRVYRPLPAGPGEPGQAPASNFPALVDEDTWLRLTATLTARGTRPGQTRRGHLLTGLAWCGVCGGRLSTEGDPGRYVCRAGHLARLEAETDRWVTFTILAWLEPGGAYDRAAAAAAAGDDPGAQLRAPRTRTPS